MFLEEQIMKNKRSWIVSGVCVATVIGMLFSLAMGAVRRPSRQRPPGFRRLREAAGTGQMNDVLRRLGVNTFRADVSLEVREQDDFLVTPALLVQEAISDGVVLTYPEE